MSYFLSLRDWRKRFFGNHKGSFPRQRSLFYSNHMYFRCWWCCPKALKLTVERPTAFCGRTASAGDVLTLLLQLLKSWITTKPLRQKSESLISQQSVLFLWAFYYTSPTVRLRLANCELSNENTLCDPRTKPQKNTPRYELVIRWIYEIINTQPHARSPASS